MAAKRIDTVVIGAGHNGLIAAAALAKAGRTVVVLERAERSGGILRGSQPAPGSVLPDWSTRSGACAHQS
jgi:protoporphyrinogen oxidase